jgi:hypothetical protein
MSKDTQGNAGRVQAASNFAASHPGEQPSAYYSNGDDYQNMQSGWMTCLTLPGGGVGAGSYRAGRCAVGVQP